MSTEKQKIYNAFSQYLEGEITADLFCDQFRELFDLEEGNGDFTQEEMDLLTDFSPIINRMSTDENDHTNYPGVYYTEEYMREIAIKVKELLDRK
jgi:hypothetical protein